MSGQTRWNAGKPAPMPVHELQRILRYNPETGGFVWLTDRGCNFAKMPAGSRAGSLNKVGYVIIKINGGFFRAHRLAWYLMTAEWPDANLEIDHINEVKRDNRWCNLRLVTRSENQRNIASKRTWVPRERPVGPQKVGRGFKRPAPMSGEELRSVFAYDPDSGLLTWKACPPGGNGAVRNAPGSNAGCRSVWGYIVVRLNKVLYPAHRLIWLMMTDEWPPEVIDHVNGIKDDNRFENLRLATASQNAVNKPASRPNTSGYRGVVRLRDKWIAQIVVNGRNMRLGTFETPEAAHAAYVKASREHHGAFGRTT